jgi:hypothetical protein
VRTQGSTSNPNEHFECNSSPRNYEACVPNAFNACRRHIIMGLLFLVCPFMHPLAMSDLRQEMALPASSIQAGLAELGRAVLPR